MLDHREELANGDSMDTESSEVYPSNTNGRRPGILSMKFRLREERKKVVIMSSTKYHNIEDHETEMRRFCLIKNTMERLQYEAREEKFARQQAKINNVSPSYLSASRPRSPSPPFDMEVPDVLNTYGQPTPSPINALSDDEDDLPPCKRPRLFMDDNDKENDKENSCEDRLIDVVGEKDDHPPMNDTQLIHRDVYYDSCTGESISQLQSSSSPLPAQVDTHYSNSLCCNTNDQYSHTPSSYNYSLSTILNCNNSQNTCYNSFNNGRFVSLSGSREWSRLNQQYPCGHSAILGNDLQSVVYQSLITSL